MKKIVTFILLLTTLVSIVMANAVIQKEEALNNEMYVYFFNAGHGDATIIKYKEHFILIDCGSQENGNIGTDVYKFITKELDCKHIDMLIITHPHDDHYKGFHYLLDQCRKANIIIDCIYTPNVEHKGLKKVREKAQRIPICEPLVYQKEKIGGEITVEMMRIEQTDEADINNGSIVVKNQLRKCQCIDCRRR